jgi:hypothetical protein
MDYGFTRHAIVNTLKHNLMLLISIIYFIFYKRKWTVNRLITCKARDMVSFVQIFENTLHRIYGGTKI